MLKKLSSKTIKKLCSVSNGRNFIFIDYMKGNSAERKLLTVKFEAVSALRKSLLFRYGMDTYAVE